MVVVVVVVVDIDIVVAIVVVAFVTIDADEVDAASASVVTVIFVGGVVTTVLTVLAVELSLTTAPTDTDIVGTVLAVTSSIDVPLVVELVPVAELPVVVSMPT